MSHVFSLFCLQLGPERFRAPELLFNPSLIGLEYASIPQGQQAHASHAFFGFAPDPRNRCCFWSTVVHIAIQKSDMDLRSELYKSIVLAGGSTKFPGLLGI